MEMDEMDEIDTRSLRGPSMSLRCLRCLRCLDALVARSKLAWFMARVRESARCEKSKTQSHQGQVISQLDRS